MQPVNYASGLGVFYEVRPRDGKIMQLVDRINQGQLVAVKLWLVVGLWFI